MNVKKLKGIAWLVLALMGSGTAEAQSTSDALGGTLSDMPQPAPSLTVTSVRYVHTDQLNTPRVITDENRLVVWRWNGDAFGSQPPDEAPTGGARFVFNLRLPGQIFDSETGLHYNYYRDYDPQTGRYLESDPIGLDGGTNTYGYVGGNPLSYVDPEGLQLAVPTSPGGAVVAIGALWWEQKQAADQYRANEQAVYTAMVQDANEARAAAEPVSFPERSKGQYTCTCRVNKDGRCRDNYSNNNLESAQATASGPTVQAAKKAAEKAAKDILGAKSTHHPTCRCTGPKGDQIIPTR
jgi:RHS repeat-associated protein